MPGTGAVAAVLGFVVAGFGLALVAHVLVVLAPSGGAGDDPTSAVVAPLGSLIVARRSGRRLPIRATIAEVILALELWF